VFLICFTCMIAKQHSLIIINAELLWKKILLRLQTTIFMKIRCPPLQIGKTNFIASKERRPLKRSELSIIISSNLRLSIRFSSSVCGQFARIFSKYITLYYIMLCIIVLNYIVLDGDNIMNAIIFVDVDEPGRHLQPTFRIC
jgi:hypothetical protein